MDRKTIPLLFFALCAFPSMARAHDARPVVVHLQEREDGVHVEWRVPRVNTQVVPPELEPPARCTIRTPAIRTRLEDSLLFASTWDCADSLSGQELNLVWPLFNPGLSTLFQAELQSGRIHSRLLPPGRHSWTIPQNNASAQRGTGFLTMGVRHILFGLDHLLFAICLMMLARTPGRIVLTVTGFTIAHAITLGLSTMGVIRLSVALVEAGIALSIVFVAAEIVRDDRNTLAQRYPVLAAMGFGLLHGFGFASVLRESGLTEGRLFSALLTFNVGVELGQLLLILLLGTQVASARYLARQSESWLQRWVAPGRLEPAAAYAIGAAAMFWTLERLLA